MMRRNLDLFRHAGRAIALSAGLLGLLAVATPAEARKQGHNHRQSHRADRHWDDSSDDSSEAYRRRGRARGHARYGYYDEPRYNNRGKHHRHNRFVVPQRIGRKHFANYRPYYERNVYFRPHRHQHSLFLFPVFNGYRYVMRPHYYCEGELYGGHVAYNGRRGGFRIDF